MKLNNMTQRLTLLRPEESQNTFGESCVTYVKVGECSAEKARFAGRRSDEVGEHFSAYSAEFYVHDLVDVGEGWRVEHHGGHVYNVVAVDSFQRGCKKLWCERLND